MRRVFRRLVLFAIVLPAVLIAARATAQGNADGLTFREIHFSLLLGRVMQEPRRVAVPPDGRDVYISARLSQTIVHFRRDVTDGTLEFASAMPPDATSGPYGVGDLVVSPNGRFVYVAIDFAGEFGIACLNRNDINGSLTLNSKLLSDDPLMRSLLAIVSAVVSPDGKFIYVLGTTSSSPLIETIVSIAIDPANGGMSAAQRLNLDVPVVFPFVAPYYQMVVSPDGKNLYAAAAGQQGIQIFNVNASSGEVSFDSLVDTRISGANSVIQSLTVSPDGAQLYAADSWTGTLLTLARDTSGGLTMPATARGTSEIVSLPGITRVVAAPDGAKLYTLSFGQFAGSIARVSAFARDIETGLPSLLETIVDGLSGSNSIQGNDWPTVSADSANLYLPASMSSSLAVFSSERPALPCFDFPEIADELSSLQEAYAFPEDIDGDGLPEAASMALLRESSCGGVEDGFDEAITNAYLVNRAGVESEFEVYDTGEWVPYQRSLASLRLISRTMGVYLNAAFAPFDVEMFDFYVSVSCVDGLCEPADARGSVARAADEPFAGEGDPDEDGVTNAQEWANVLARGGSEREFAVSALDASNDGSTEVSFSNGSSSCFIATAAYGTPLAAELDTLRGIRDAKLLTNPLGAAFTDAYYRLSPPAADFIATRPAWRNAARTAIALAIDNTVQIAAAALLTASLFAQLVKRRRRRN